jgi:hypothetical protein
LPPRAFGDRKVFNSALPTTSTNASVRAKLSPVVSTPPIHQDLPHEVGLGEYAMLHEAPKYRGGLKLDGSLGDSIVLFPFHGVSPRVKAY